MSDGFENCLRCRVLTEKKISFFSAHQGLERHTWLISIGMEAIVRGYQTYFVTARDLVTQLRRGGQKVGEKASCLCEANCSHDR
uniref:ATP-binding protein n=1 Tax=Ureibacillus sp. FSL K6-8385 TaxID=2954684 RepID=UPI00406BEC7D